MKIVELLIDDEEDMAGGSAIAMVLNPAHESEFLSFNKEKKSDEEMYEVIPTEEEQEKLLQQFSKVGVDNQSFMMKGYSIKSVEPIGHINTNMFDGKFSSTDINERPITDVLNDRSVLDYEDGQGKYKVRFRYAVRPGRPAIIQTTRRFCREMVNANKTYRLEDINRILNGFQQYGKTGDNWGNTMFKFGGPNCNHIFVKITYQEVFKKGEKKYNTVDEQNRDDAAIIAGSNLNQKTADNPSPQTIRRAGLGMFSSEEIQKFNDELATQYLMAGAVLIPDKLIYRLDPNTKEEYQIFFSKESVKKIAFKYMRDKNTTNTNIEHNPKQTLNDVTLVESWIVTDPLNDKSNQYGFTCEEGTWFGIVDCSKNQKFFNEYVKKGKVLGFSLEGFFESKLVKFFENEKNNSNIDVDTYILTEIENLLNTD